MPLSIISRDANSKTNVKLSKLYVEFLRNSYVGGEICREAVTVSSDLQLIRETEEVVCLSASEERSFDDGIRRILRILFANWASEKQFVNMVSRGCSGKLGCRLVTMGFCFLHILSVLRPRRFFHVEPDWHATVFFVRADWVSLPKPRTLFGGSWIRGLGVEFCLWGGPKTIRRKDRFEGVSP